jgi:uncharacterized protein YjiS (DUF1127 family)
MQLGLRAPLGAGTATLPHRDTVPHVPERHAPAWPAWFGALLRRRREREELLNLGPRERRDARLTDYDVRALARKPFWRP